MTPAAPDKQRRSRITLLVGGVGLRTRELVASVMYSALTTERLGLSQAHTYTSTLMYIAVPDGVRGASRTPVAHISNRRDATPTTAACLKSHSVSA